jgi:hypothetical protein
MAEVFEGKSLQNLLAEIHYNTTEKRDMIIGIINTLKDKIDSIDDIIVVAPIIKDYLDVLVKSDEHLIKIGVIVQRIQSAEKGGGSLEDLFSEDEREKLVKEAKAEIDEGLKKLGGATENALKQASVAAGVK